jgi:hypothetical protein
MHLKHWSDMEHGAVHCSLRNASVAVTRFVRVDMIPFPDSLKL